MEQLRGAGNATIPVVISRVTPHMGRKRRLLNIFCGGGTPGG